jgi:STE24 endopeptidase
MGNNTAIDMERQQKAKEYSRISRRLMLVDLVLGGVYILVWLLTGASEALKSWLAGYTSNDWLLVALYGLVFGGLYLLVNLPLSYYQEYVLPHRYGQSNQDLRGWISDQLKGLAIGGVVGGLMLEIIYAVLRAFPATWWLWAAGILLLFSVLLANLAPILLYPLFYKFIPLGEDHAELAERLTRLAERANTRVQGVYKFDMSRRTKSANAALAGLSSSRRIILGDTLLAEFTPDEIETVLAHELGHQVHKDIPVGIGIETIITLVGCTGW